MKAAAALGLCILCLSFFSAAAEGDPITVVGAHSHPPVADLEAGSAGGIAFDLVRALAAALDRAVVTKLMDQEIAEREILTGRADLLAVLTITEARRALYDFSTPVLNVDYGFITHAGGEPLSGPKDAEGLRIGAIRGERPQQVLGTNPKIDLIYVPNYRRGVEMLQSGDIDALAADVRVGDHFVRHSDQVSLRLSDPPFATAIAAFAVKKGNQALLQEIDRGLAQLQEAGIVEHIVSRRDEGGSLSGAPGLSRGLGLPLAAALLLCGVLVIAVIVLWRRAARNTGDLGQARTAMEARIAERTQDLVVSNAAQRKAEQDYREIFENSVLGIFRTTPDGRLLEANDAMARLHGYASAAELLAATGNVKDEIWLSDEQRQSFLRLLEEREALHGVKLELYQHRTRKKIWVNQNVRLVRDEDGRFIYYEGIAEDITARRQAEALVKESEARLRDFTRAASDWYWELDESLCYSFFSERREAMTGRAPEPDLGKTPWDVFGPEEPWPAFKSILEFHQAFRDFRYSFADAAGTQRHFKMSGVPIFAQDGGFKGYRCTSARETDEVPAQARAEQAEARLLDAIDSMSEGFAVYDAEERLVMVNDQALTMTGASREDFPKGTTYREVARRLAYSGVLLDAQGGPEAWLQDHLASRGQSPDGIELPLSNGHWTLMRIHPTREGGSVVTATDITAMKQTALALRERESQLTEAQRIGRVGHWLWEVETDRVERSLEMCRLMGLDPSLPAPTGAEGDARVHPDDREQFRDHHTRSLRSGDPIRIDYRFVRPDGDIRVFSEEAHPRQDDDGEVTSVFGITRDITEAKEAEIALRERELSEAQRVGHIGHWRIFMAGGRVEISDEMYRIYGGEPNWFDPSLETGNDLIHPEDRARIIAERDAAIANKEPYSSVCRIVRPDGGVRYVESRGYPELDRDGEVVSLFGITQDVTEAKLAEEALRNSERRFQDFAASASDWYWEYDENLRTSYLSESYFSNDPGAKEWLMGKTRRELLAAGDPVIDDTTTIETWMAHIADLEAHLAFRDFEYPLHLASGQIRYFSISGKPVFDEAEVFLGYRGTLTDITERKQQQRQREELEQSLRQLHKMQSLGELASNMAHEINNMLQPILTFSKLTQDQVEDQKLHGYQERILDSGRKVRDIVRDVLTFGRRESPEIEAVDAQDLLQSALRLARDLTPSRIAFHIEISDASGSVFVNSSEFTQVILNLVSNAADAMEGTGTIRIRAHFATVGAAEAQKWALAAGDYLHLSLADHGIGIPEDQLERVFEPFYTTKPEGQGTGLGLSVVYGIVQGWRGRITVVSDLGEGAVFHIHIPAGTRQAQSPEAASG